MASDHDAYRIFHLPFLGLGIMKDICVIVQI